MRGVLVFESRLQYLSSEIAVPVEAPLGPNALRPISFMTFGPALWAHASGLPVRIAN